MISPNFLKYDIDQEKNVSKSANSFLKESYVNSSVISW